MIFVVGGNIFQKILPPGGYLMGRIFTFTPGANSRKQFFFSKTCV